MEFPVIARQNKYVCTQRRLTVSNCKYSIVVSDNTHWLRTLVSVKLYNVTSRPIATMLGLHYTCDLDADV